MWDVETGEELFSHLSKLPSEGFTGGPRVGAAITAAGITRTRRYSPAGNRFLAFGSRLGVTEVFDSTSFELIASLSDGTRNFHHRSEFSPDGAYVLTHGYNQPTVTIWDSSGRRIRSFGSSSEGAIMTTAFDPSVTHLATGTVSGRCNVYAIDNGALKYSLSPRSAREEDLAEYDGRVHKVVFSPDGRWLAAGTSAGQILIVDMLSKELTNFLTKHNLQVIDLAFSPSGERLMSASSDKTVKVWDLEGNQLLSFEVKDDLTTCIWGDNGRSLFASTTSGKIYTWSSIATPSQSVSSVEHVDQLLEEYWLQQHNILPEVRELVQSIETETLKSGWKDSIAQLFEIIRPIRYEHMGISVQEIDTLGSAIDDLAEMYLEESDDNVRDRIRAEVECLAEQLYGLNDPSIDVMTRHIVAMTNSSPGFSRYDSSTREEPVGPTADLLRMTVEDCLRVFLDAYQEKIRSGEEPLLFEASLLSISLDELMLSLARMGVEFDVDASLVARVALLYVEYLDGTPNEMVSNSLNDDLNDILDDDFSALYFDLQALGLWLFVLAESLDELGHNQSSEQSASRALACSYLTGDRSSSIVYELEKVAPFSWIEPPNPRLIIQPSGKMDRIRSPKNADPNQSWATLGRTITTAKRYLDRAAPAPDYPNIHELLTLNGGSGVDGNTPMREFISSSVDALLERR